MLVILKKANKIYFPNVYTCQKYCEQDPIFTYRWSSMKPFLAGCSHFHSRYERRLIFELFSNRFYFRSLKKLILFALLRHSNMSRKSFSCRNFSCVDTFLGLFSSISKTLNFRNRLITTYKLILLLSIPCDLI